eukprot:scaffold22537_cov19-Prasinocladus_malaysianus.AAC.1
MEGGTSNGASSSGQQNALDSKPPARPAHLASLWFWSLLLPDKAREGRENDEKSDEPSAVEKDCSHYGIFKLSRYPFMNH